MVEVKQIRGAVIGYGGAFNMGRGHLNWMQEAGITPVAACDLDEARMRVAAEDFPGLRTYTTVEGLLADDGVDLVTIITPHDSHAPLAIQALNAGKAVITEKPMCLTSQEATDMIAASQKNGVMLSVFHNRRHDGDFLALKEAIVEKKRLGDVFSIQAGFAGYGHPGHWWRSNKAISGGAFYDWGAHFLDWILNLMPGQKVVSVTGFFHKRLWHDVTNEDHVQAILRFDSGAHADLSFSSISSLPLPRWRIQGTQGGILDDGSVKDGMTLFGSLDGLKVQGELRNKPTLWGQYYKDIYAHLAEGGPLDVTPESARRVIAVIEAAEKSARSGQAEPVAFE
jgi:scyllo-inositol 2-dehydrogenase (NADP+)